MSAEKDYRQDSLDFIDYILGDDKIDDDTAKELSEVVETLYAETSELKVFVDSSFFDMLRHSPSPVKTTLKSLCHSLVEVVESVIYEEITEDFDEFYHSNRFKYTIEKLRGLISGIVNGAIDDELDETYHFIYSEVEKDNESDKLLSFIFFDFVYDKIEELAEKEGIKLTPLSSKPKGPTTIPKTPTKKTSSMKEVELKFKEETKNGTNEVFYLKDSTISSSSDRYLLEAIETSLGNSFAIMCLMEEDYVDDDLDEENPIDISDIKGFDGYNQIYKINAKNQGCFNPSISPRHGYDSSGNARFVVIEESVFEDGILVKFLEEGESMSDAELIELTENIEVNLSALHAIKSSGTSGSGMPPSMHSIISKVIGSGGKVMGVSGSGMSHITLGSPTSPTGKIRKSWAEADEEESGAVFYPGHYSKDELSKMEDWEIIGELADKNFSYREKDLVFYCYDDDLYIMPDCFDYLPTEDFDMKLPAHLNIYFEKMEKDDEDYRPFRYRLTGQSRDWSSDKVVSYLTSKRLKEIVV